MAMAMHCLATHQPRQRLVWHLWRPRHAQKIPSGVGPSPNGVYEHKRVH